VRVVGVDKCGTWFMLIFPHSYRYFSLKFLYNRADKILKLDKGKPLERVGRKATGLIPKCRGYGSRVAY
jgi:hypothetical protein